MKRMWVIVGVVTLSLAAAACGGGGGDSGKRAAATPAGQATASQAKAGQASASEAGTVNVALKDFSITPSAASLPAGRVTFQVSNQGPSEHELVVLKTSLSPRNLPVKAGAVSEEAKGIKNIGEVEGVGTGDAKSTTLNLAAGRYLFVCNIPGHYLAGMVTAFTVT